MINNSKILIVIKRVKLYLSYERFERQRNTMIKTSKE